MAAGKHRHATVVLEISGVGEAFKQASKQIYMAVLTYGIAENDVAISVIGGTNRNSFDSAARYVSWRWREHRNRVTKL